MDYFGIIDLTATYGAGNEPTLAAMDAFMNKFNGVFTGVENRFELASATSVIQEPSFPTPPKYPTPATLSDVEITSISEKGNIELRQMDKNGVLYGVNHSTHTIVKSTDYGESFQDVITVPSQHFEIWDAALVVTDIGTIVVSTIAGHVLYVNEAQDTITQVFNFDSGYPRIVYNYSVYNNIVILGVYGFSDTPPHQIILSTDYGATFKMILDKNSAIAPVTSMTPRFHWHDVEYDPYAKRILATPGDGSNRQVFYSDDMGGTWKKMFSGPEPLAIQTTSILALPHGIIFGSDSKPDGLRYWLRPKNSSQPEMKEKDFIPDFYTFNDDPDSFEHIARKASRVRSRNMEMYMICYSVEILQGSGNDYPRILASADGYHWSEIYKYQHPAGQRDQGFMNIIGPHPEDPQHRVFGTFQKGLEANNNRALLGSKRLFLNGSNAITTHILRGVLF